MNLPIQQKALGTKEMFYIEQDGAVVAEMLYSLPDPGTMIIEHTEVNDLLKGKGVGLQLVRSGVEYARAHNMKIVPRCPFAKSVFEKKPEFADVLAH